jgi:CheY-like chemotaxis protein
MEAVGRLAGGLAHDFNNLLCVILTYAELIGAGLRDEDPMRSEIEEIHLAGTRATDLTRQLLAFSRQQVLDPRPIDLNQVVGSVERMLRRLVGPSIEMTILCEPALRATIADARQIEQVLMNLVVNAHDAMPRGGKLTIETRSVELGVEEAREPVDAKPGPHVVLRVSDTGAGMDEKTQAHVFEPFYTTKPLGKGTGLGLATVFGIVQQSGGHVRLRSEVGVGTTFEVYLPATEEAAQSIPAPLPTLESTRGTETVLLVETEEHVRVAARTILLRSGYHVLEAPGPGEALLISEQHVQPIHLLLSAVVMPRMSGPELATRVRAKHPEIKTLLMSGYSNAVSEYGVPPNVTYLQKPISPSTLTAKVREALDDESAEMSAG